MKPSKIAGSGFLHAIAATAYVAFVAFVMSHANTWFGARDTSFTPMAALMLFVLSASVMGSLVFLRPLLWYIDGKKREALALLGWIIGFIFVFTLAAFALLAVAR